MSFEGEGTNFGNLESCQDGKSVGDMGYTNNTDFLPFRYFSCPISGYIPTVSYNIMVDGGGLRIDPPKNSPVEGFKP